MVCADMQGYPYKAQMLDYYPANFYEFRVCLMELSRRGIVLDFPPTANT